MSSHDLSIRPFHSGDIKDLTILINELGYPTTAEQMAERMQVITRLPNYWTLLAEDQGQAIGFIGINKSFFWEQDGHYMRIQALVVRSNCRREGVGRKLIEAAEQLARRLETKMLILNCGNREERQAAHIFYTRVGFEARSTGYAKSL